MTWTLLPIVFFCTLHLNAAKLMNVKVTIPMKDIHTLFDDGEIWGMEFNNVTRDMVQVEVVIDEAKSLKILQYPTVMGFETIHPDAEAAIHKTAQRLRNRTPWTSQMEPDTFFLDYRDWPEYEAFIGDFPDRFPTLASVDYLPGETIQGREIPVVTLSTSSGEKPGFYLQASLHAREWIANSALTYILNALAEGYGVDDRITEILEGVNFYIVPTVNVDGYIYTWAADRMWRKNRRANSGGSFGVDLNRNYGAPTGTWCGPGASSNPTSNTYCGTSAYSEPETQASRDFMRNDSYNIQAAWDMHTSGPMILHPYGYTHDHISDPAMQEFYVDLGANLQEQVALVHGQQYRSMSASDLYICSGTAVDFGFADAQMEEAISFTFEGRGPGFDPPASNIIPAGQEELAAVLYMADLLNGPDAKFPKKKRN